MFLSKVLPLALIVAVSHADVIRNSQSPTLRHDPPTPSTYPLNEPCVPEWQYLNFNPDDANDKTRLEKLHHVLCSGELRAVWNYRKLSARDLLIPYKHYFPSSEEVYDFFQTPIQEIEALVGTFVVDNFDFGDDCTMDDILSYTLTDQLDSREKIHFCDPAWTHESADSVHPARLNPFSGTTMNTFLRFVLREINHSVARSRYNYHALTGWKP